MSFTIFNLVLNKSFNIPCFNPFKWQNKRATTQSQFCLWNNCWSPESFWHSRSWQQVSDIDIKLNRKNAIWSKLRYFIDRKTQKYSIFNIQYSIFKPYLCYSSLFWAQNLNSIRRLLFCKRNPCGLYIFEVVMLIHLIYFKSPTF